MSYDFVCLKAGGRFGVGGTTYMERQKEEIQERGRRKIVEDHDCGGRLIHKRERDGIAWSLRFKLG